MMTGGFTAAGDGEQTNGWRRAEQREGGRAHGGNEVQVDSSAAPTCGDKVANPRGVAVTGVTGGRRRLCRERGHRLVTGCAATGMRPGNRVAHLSHFGPWPMGRPEFKICPIFKIT
jgi:hypothetical protein